jgi:hypothetical protein
MIIWINGAFAAGKTTLAEELERRLPDAMPFDPEYVGYILIKWVPPADSGDFQDIPLWRRLVADFATSSAASRPGPACRPTPWSCGVTSTRRPSWLISSSRPRAEVVNPHLAK